MLKYFLYYEGSSLALKYHNRKKEMIIGGNKKFIFQMRLILEIYFKRSVENYVQRFTQKNKVRFITKINLADFVKGKILIRENNGVLTQVKDLGRIMR